MFRRFILSAAAAALVLFPAPGRAQVAECESFNVRVKGVARNSPATATVDFSGSNGQLDPNPLLQTQIQVFARTCVVVHFSAQADPQDNAIVFQASIDNVPMSGHAQFAPFLTPVVLDHEETDQNLSRMVAYTFIAVVNPGVHTVRIRFASCCSANASSRSGVVRNAVMAVHF